VRRASVYHLRSRFTPGVGEPPVTILDIVRLTSVRVAAAFVVILGAGLGAGWLLLQYDEGLGFREEADRIAEVLQLRPGLIVADVRAGSGGWTVDMAKRVGQSGRIFATVSPNNPAHEIFQALAEAEIDNVNVIGRTTGTSQRLPLNCCDAILLRGVYHDFPDRETIAGGLVENLRPGGRMAVIDFAEGTPEQLSGHGLAQETLIAEMKTAGFAVEQVIDDWFGNAYCILFRRPVEP
jgi:precorrin-6B methylase 2